MTTLIEDSATPSPPEAGESEDGLPQDSAASAQLSALLDGAVNVATQLATAPGKEIFIHPREAEYLQLVPHQLLHDITNLAIRRVQMRDGHDYMQKGDIDWAWTRLVVGRRANAWLTVLNSVGGILLGAGIPIVVAPFLNDEPLQTSGLLLAMLLLVPGLVMMSLALAISVRR